jgi:hypothetical protein
MILVMRNRTWRVDGVFYIFMLITTVVTVMD